MFPWPRKLSAQAASKAAHDKDENLTDGSDFDPVQTSAAASFNESIPASSASAPAVSAPTVEFAEGNGIPAPQLLGKTVRDVTQECMKLGLIPVLVGTGMATEQTPEAGAAIRRGSRITVQFARSASLLSAAARGKAK